MNREAFLQIKNQKGYSLTTNFGKKRINCIVVLYELLIF